MASQETIYAPIEGNLINITKVSDPVFAEKMLGDGLAIQPNLGVQNIVAPCDCIIETLHDSNHAVALTTAHGITILLHVGIDTVKLQSKGFKAFVKVGQSVKKGEKLLEVDFDFISKNAPSIDVIMVFTNLSEDQKLFLQPEGHIEKQKQLVVIDNKDASVKLEAVQSVSSNSNEVFSEVLTVANHTGIHARPASAIFQIANRYKSTIELRSNDKKANAKSVISILGMGIKFNDKIEFVANGDDASSAVAELSKAVIDGLGENVAKSGVSAVASSNVVAKDIVTDFSKTVTLKGVLASPGMVIGKSLMMSEEEIKVNEQGGSVENELTLLNNALKQVHESINNDIAVANAKSQKTQVEIFNAHLNILQDPAIVENARKYISQGKSSAFAWSMSIKDSVSILQGSGNALLIERVADLKDIKRRVISKILGLPDKTIDSFPENTVIVAKDLVPSDLSKFDENVKAVVLSHGSATAHVALMLRNMGVPAIVSLGDSLDYISDGTNLIVDANDKTLVINPDANILAEMVEKHTKIEKVRAENISHAMEPAVTKDGVAIKVKGNVSNALEASKALALGAEGVGLLRTEFLFFNSQNAPTEAEQILLYQGALDSMQGGSVTLRTLDVGGDKPLSYVHIDPEENPILGMRGVRNYFNNKEIFLTQVRSILKVKPLILVKIMVPMISDISEMIAVKAIIEEEKKILGINVPVEIGTMIEVPSSAILAEQMAKYVDFFSIGTNDLAQYVMAMDRGNSHLTKKLNNLHPAILKLIKMTVDGGNLSNKPTAVCGAMASELSSIPILLGLGVHELSTSMKSIPDVKALIRTLNYAQCVEVANKALTFATADEVEKLVLETFNI